MYEIPVDLHTAGRVGAAFLTSARLRHSVIEAIPPARRPSPYPSSSKHRATVPEIVQTKHGTAQMPTAKDASRAV
ncbi:hypothetical protein RSPO_c00582 [Ralstonia solanacearum Po82]|uniref:Uncharacterized protein n=1 Tax=Ralstonia solanacearum (strain Po82) TaxID=1031711 RepID=F6FY81_RALS8|nr:hypothetical protein RSPO_c00582 [Ralstonia solanacearum Po82]